jgi:rhomboid family GlyGly-CTERM serine protease
MIAEPSATSVKVWGPPAALALLSTLLMLGGSPLSQLLRYDRAAVAAGQWWRLFSANLVHLGWWHLLFNVLSLVLLVLLCPERLGWAEWLRRVVLIGTGMSLCLYFFAPGLQDYVGLSGLVYGLFALGLGRQALRRDEIGIACLVFLAARIGWELVKGAPESETKLLGGGVVAESHLFGVVCALLYAAAAYAASRIHGQFFKQSGHA